MAREEIVVECRRIADMHEEVVCVARIDQPFPLGQELPELTRVLSHQSNRFGRMPDGVATHACDGGRLRMCRDAPRNANALDRTADLCVGPTANATRTPGSPCSLVSDRT